MENKNKKAFGGITISEEVVISVATEAALSAYGVVSIASQPPKSKLLDEVFKLDPKPGVVVTKRSGAWHVSLYLNVMYGLKLTEIVSTVQAQVKYTLEKTFDTTFKAVNIFIVAVSERE